MKHRNDGLQTIDVDAARPGDGEHPAVGPVTNGLHDIQRAAGFHHRLQQSRQLNRRNVEEKVDVLCETPVAPHGHAQTTDERIGNAVLLEQRRQDFHRV